MSLICLSPNGVDHYRVDDPPDGVVVATMDGVARLARDPGDRWHVGATTLAGQHISSLMREPTRGFIYAGIHGGSLYRSRDGGHDWEPAAEGINENHVFSLACRAIAGGVELYAGTEPAHLYRSRDYGDHWEELTGLQAIASRPHWNFPPPPFIAHVKHVAFDPRDPRVLYVCVEQGALLKSEDGGATFRELDFQDASYALNKDTHRIIFNPRNPDEIFLPGGDGISASTDAGAHWRHLTTPKMRIAYPDHFYVSPEQDGTLYAAGGGDPPNVWRETGDARSGIVISRDNGESWQEIGGGLPATLPGNIEAVTLAEWPGGFGFVAGTTDGEVYASFDKGRNWRRIASGLAAVSKCVHARNLAMGRAKVKAAV